MTGRAAGGDGRGPRRAAPTDAERDEAAAELGRVRDAIDELDKAIVELLNERATLGREADGPSTWPAAAPSRTLSASARC